MQFIFGSLDLVVCLQHQPNGGGVNWCFVPVEHLALFHHLRPLLLQNLKESSEGIHNEDSIHGLPILYRLGVDEPVGDEEGDNHLLCGAHMHPCPNWAWLALLDLLLAHSFCFGSVEGHNGFVHGQNTVEKGFGLTAKGGNDFLQILILSSFCSNDKSLGTHLSHFFSRPSSSYRRSKIVLIDT